MNDKSNGRHRFENQPLVELHQVTKIYESGVNKYPALLQVNLKVMAGEFLAVVGKSGSGKSTLLNMLTGIDRPTTGEVFVANTPLHKLSEGKMAVWRGRNLGIVFQFFQLLPTLTIIENIMLPMDFCHKYSLRQRRERAKYLLDQVELADQAHKLPASLSGGQQQRVAIARALANDPPIIVADEPTGNLDTNTAAAMLILFKKLIDKGKTIILVSHDQDLVNQTSRTIYLVDGRIVNDTAWTRSVPKKTDFAQVKEPGEQIAVNNSNIDQIRNTVREILRNPTTASKRLKDEVLSNPQDQLGEAVYQAVMDEINEQATASEKAGNFEEARMIWRILIEATE